MNPVHMNFSNNGKAETGRIWPSSEVGGQYACPCCRVTFWIEDWRREHAVVTHHPGAQPQLSPPEHVNFSCSKPSFSTNSSSCSGTLLLKHFFTPSAQLRKSLYCSATKVPSTSPPQSTTFLITAPSTLFPLLQIASTTPKPLAYILVISLIQSNPF